MAAATKIMAVAVTVAVAVAVAVAKISLSSAVTDCRETGRDTRNETQAGRDRHSDSTRSSVSAMRLRLPQVVTHYLASTALLGRGIRSILSKSHAY